MGGTRTLFSSLSSILPIFLKPSADFARVGVATKYHGIVRMSLDCYRWSIHLVYLLQSAP
jgi:hypothetical protein